MVEYITRRLGIPAPQRIIHIEDIATPEEISRALEIREKENRHVIPIPTFAIEKDFPGYLLDPLKAFFRNKSKPLPYRTLEHSIVRPLYSSLGNYFLSENVIEQLAVYVAEHVDGVVKAKKTAIISTKNGMVVELEVVLRYGLHIPRLLLETQKQVKEKLENLTGLQVYQVNITARRITVEGKN